MTRSLTHPLISLSLLLALTCFCGPSHATPTTQRLTQHHKAPSKKQPNPCLRSIKRSCFPFILRRVWQKAKHMLFDRKVAKRHFTKRSFTSLLRQAKRAKNFAQFAQRLDLFLRQTGISHTRFLTTSQMDYWFLRNLTQNDTPHKRPKLWHIGAQYTFKRGRYIIRAVYEGYPADERGLRRGDVLKYANGRPFHPVHSFQRGKTQQLTVLRQGKRYLISVQPVYESLFNSMLFATVNSIQRIERDNKHIGYVHLWHMCHEPAFQLLKDLLAFHLPNIDGLILDLRDGYGGNSYGFQEIFFHYKQGVHVKVRQRRKKTYAYTTNDHLETIQWEFSRLKKKLKTSTPKQRPLLQARWKVLQKQRQQLKASPLFKKPVVVIINKGSRSAKEGFALRFRLLHRGPLLGERTKGAYTAGGFYFGRSGHYILYVGTAGITLNGHQLEGQGVRPDIQVPSPLHSKTRQDRQKRRALRVITSLISEKIVSNNDHHKPNTKTDRASNITPKRKTDKHRR